MGKQESRSAREFWLRYWYAGSFVADRLAKLARCMAIANMLQVNNIGFDIHIVEVSPNISGGLTTELTGFNEFKDLDDLIALLEMASDILKGMVADDKHDQ